MIYFFGDSYTYGTELDADATGNIKPSELAYPHLVGKHLNVSIKNCALGGIGNKEIFHRITQQLFQPEDFVVVMWTTAQRQMFLTDDKNKYNRIDYQDLSSKVEAYYKYFNSSSNTAFESSSYIALANYYVKDLIGDRIYNLATPLYDEKELLDWNHVDVFPAFNNSHIVKDDCPGGHEGPKTHSKFAKVLARTLLDKI